MNGALLPADEMAQELRKRQNKRLSGYKEQADSHKAEMLSADLGRHIEALKMERSRADLRDIDEVKERTLEYLKACKLAEVYPSVMGLASHGFGMSVQGLNRFLREHPRHESAEYIERVKSVFADILVNQSLYRNADAAQAIFQLKNHHGHADKIEIEAVPRGSMLDELDEEAVKRRIDSLVSKEDIYED